MHIAVMLRSNVFAGCRSRTTQGRAGPVEVYNVANTAVAQHLAKEGLQLPTCFPSAWPPSQCDRHCPGVCLRQAGARATTSTGVSFEVGWPQQKNKTSEQGGKRD